jgi:hypothetical protein
MVTFQNSYVITNREYPANTVFDIEPLSGGQMWFYMATGNYNPETSQYNAVPQQPGQQPAPSTTPPSAFLSALAADIQSQPGTPQLTILIHGLATLFSDAIGNLSTLGNGLQQYATYNGLVVAFDWPSYGEAESGIYYASSPYGFPPTATNGTIRDNINGSAPAFQNLVAMIQSLQQNISNLQVNVVCHSEGNYMLMTGMYYLNQAGISARFSQVLMLAADINSGALQVASDALTGQGAAISSSASQVTVYYSGNDTVLSGAELAFEQYHNPEYYARLGLEGPANYLTGSLNTNVIGLNCSAVINQQATQNIIPPNVTLHSAYFYVPQVISDIAQTLDLVAPGSVTDRISGGAQSGQEYLMTLNATQKVLAVRRTRAARAATSSGSR